MNTSTYNQALNQAMPWTAKLQDIDVEELETIDTCTEYGIVKISDNKGSTIL